MGNEFKIYKLLKNLSLFLQKKSQDYEIKAVVNKYKIYIKLQRIRKDKRFLINFLLVFLVIDTLYKKLKKKLSLI